MASLRFTFDGERRPERRNPMPPFQPRYISPLGFYRPMPAPVPVPSEPEPAEPPIAAEVLPISEEKMNMKPVYTPVPVSVPLNDQKSDPQEEEKQVASVSERFVGQLTGFETTLTKTRGHVDTAKILCDNVIYKLDSVMQIMEIISANEEQRIRGAQVQVSTTKTGKDTIDQFLELLQTPAFQNILRQVMVGLLVKK